MGIKRLNKFIQEKKLTNEYPNLEFYLKHNKKQGKNTVIAIDFWLYAYKFTYSYGNMLYGFWNQATNFLSHRVIPLYVFDGLPPTEKEVTLLIRQKKKQNIESKLKKIKDAIQKDEDNYGLEKEKQRLEKSLIKVTKQDIIKVKQLFDVLNVPYVTAIGEADALCARLYKDDIITACLSDDMDMLAFGCGKTIKFSEGKIIEYDLARILEELKFTYFEFIDMCILFGCDYIRTCNKLDYMDSYKLITQYRSIDNIFSNAEHSIVNIDNDKCKILLDNHKNVHKLFTTLCNKEETPDNKNISITKKIEVSKVFNFLIEHCPNIMKYKSNQIKNSICYINHHIENNLMNTG